MNNAEVFACFHGRTARHRNVRAYWQRNAENKTPYFTGLNNVKFRNKVLPGDEFETICEITKSRPPFYFATAKGSVNGKLAVSADFSFALI
jgi:3-hydroxyacyl-[acyl-carrier-protein] dehydratase